MELGGVAFLSTKKILGRSSSPGFSERRPNAGSTFSMRSSSASGSDILGSTSGREYASASSNPSSDR